MSIKFRLKELIAKRERQFNIRITYRDIHQATGINLNTITAMANNDMSMVALSTIERLTDYFSCGIADLMIKEPVMAKSFILDQFKGTKLTRAQIKKIVKKSRQKGRTVSLRKADLRGLDLSRLDLSEVDFGNSILTGADLSGASLAYANLSSADLTRADLSGADLQGAILAWADLSEAELTDTDLSQADLYQATV